MERTEHNRAWLLLSDSNRPRRKGKMIRDKVADLRIETAKYHDQVLKKRDKLDIVCSFSIKYKSSAIDMTRTPPHHHYQYLTINPPQRSSTILLLPIYSVRWAASATLPLTGPATRVQETTSRMPQRWPREFRSCASSWIFC